MGLPRTPVLLLGALASAAGCTGGPSHGSLLEILRGDDGSVGAGPIAELPSKDERRTLSAPGLPPIHAFVSAPDDHVTGLVQQALQRLGMSAERGPRSEDRVFVGHYYIAWIDQTGFVGKMNGLWQLNGMRGYGLDFVLVDAANAGQPVNVFVPGENGDGAWPKGYAGAEHVEVPNLNRPGGGDCGETRGGEKRICGQYGHMEAPEIGQGAANESWRSCNARRGDWEALHETLSDEVTEDGVRWIYSAPLVRVADFETGATGNDCGEDWVFADGTKGRVDLRSGYRLYANRPWVDRIHALANSAGNPAFATPYSVIGGFVMTSWPDPHALKRLDRFWRLAPGATRSSLCWGDSECAEDERIVLEPGVWTRVGDGRAATGHDVVLSWSGGAFTMSSDARPVRGRSFTVDVLGDHDDLDVGGCLCAVHGGVEMGGGLLHGGGPELSLPIAGGTMASAVRRLTLHP